MPKRFAYDTETTSLKISKMQIVGMSFYSGTGKPAYIQFNFTDKVENKIKDGRKTVVELVDYKHDKGIDFEDARPYLEQILEGAEAITANGKFDTKVLWRFGLPAPKIVGDCNMASYLYDNTRKGGLKEHWQHYMGEKSATFEEVTGMKAGRIDWRAVNFFEFGQYGAKDPYMTWLLESHLRAKLEEMKLLSCYDKLELPLIEKVAKTEYRGVLIDKDFLLDMGRRLVEKSNELENIIYGIMGCKINLNSGKQLGQVLFDQMKLPVMGYTGKGERSTDEAALKNLAYRGHSVALAVLQYRKAVKMLGTYVEGILELVDDDGRLRGNFNQSFTDTGRFSSSGPNLQNIPNDKKWRVKESFIAGPGRKLIVCDWSNIEVRVMAHESGDKVLTELFNTGGDMHQNTMNMVKELTGMELPRTQAKRINFGVLYGMWGESLANNLNFDMLNDVLDGKMSHEDFKAKLFSPEQGQQLVDSFYKAYTGFTKWTKEVIKEAQSKKYARSMSGRVRRLLEANTNRGARQAVNFIIQGGAADLMKRGIIVLDEMYEAKGYDAVTVMYVHDEYIIDVREDQADDCFRDVKEVLSNLHPKFRVPIVVEGGIYDNWNGLKGAAKSGAF
jgi:DNA polymerase-1